MLTVASKVSTVVSKAPTLVVKPVEVLLTVASKASTVVSKVPTLVVKPVEVLLTVASKASTVVSKVPTLVVKPVEASLTVVSKVPTLVSNPLTVVLIPLRPAAVNAAAIFWLIRLVRFSSFSLFTLSNNSLYLPSASVLSARCFAFALSSSFTKESFLASTFCAQATSCDTILFRLERPVEFEANAEEWLFKVFWIPSISFSILKTSPSTYSVMLILFVSNLS